MTTQRRIAWLVRARLTLRPDENGVPCMYLLLELVEKNPDPGPITSVIWGETLETCCN